MMNMWRVYALSACLAAWGMVSSPVHANLLNSELLVNGDAEDGNTSGWVSTGAAAAFAVTQTAPGDVGVPAGESIGNWSFFGGQNNPAFSQLTQTVDVSGLAGLIDAGMVDANFHILVQSRNIPGGGVEDVVAGSLNFLNAGGGLALAVLPFSDENTPVNIFDWHEIDAQVDVPVGTRSVELILNFNRPSGVSTDAYADNASLALVPEPTGFALLGAGGLLMLRRWR